MNNSQFLLKGFHEIYCLSTSWPHNDWSYHRVSWLCI